MTISTDTDVDNLVDRAAQSADQALEATRRAAGAAIDSVSRKVHGVRDVASPALDRLTSPFDALANRTQASPLQYLMLAAAVGAAMMAVVSLVGARR